MELAWTSASSPLSRFIGFGDSTTLRFGDDQRSRRFSFCPGIEKKTRNPIPRLITTASASPDPLFLSQHRKDSPKSEHYVEVIKSYHQLFAREISTQSSEISIAKVLLYIAAGDQAFLALNRELDALSDRKEWGFFQNRSGQSATCSEKPESVQYLSDLDSEELLLLDGKSVSGWLSELDLIAKEVGAELVSRDIGRSLSQVPQAVNSVLIGLKGFRRTSNEMASDPKYSYLHSVLNCRRGTAFLLGIICIEVCQRLGVHIVDSGAGDFRVTSGQSVNDTVNNRDVIEAALTNLNMLYWKRASKSFPGLTLTSTLKDIDSARFRVMPPADIRLAIAAAERLLLLDLKNWRLRRDIGVLFFYLRLYGEAIQELSICIVFAPEEEAKELKIFIMKLHILRDTQGMA